MKLFLEVLLAVFVVFFGSWLVSTSFMLMSLPNDLAVAGGVIGLIVTSAGVGASAIRHGRMIVRHFNERTNRA